MIKKIMKLFPVCIFIYYLFSQVYGLDAHQWPENVGGVYIGVEICAIGFIIMAATMPESTCDKCKRKNDEA